MANRFFTVLIVPEQSSKVSRFMIPAWVVKSAGITFLFVAALTFMMLMDYWFVMKQIDETKELRLENRRLRQLVQINKNKMTSFETTMERIQTFATRLRVITNIEDSGGPISKLDVELPDASTNVGRESSRDPKDQALEQTEAAAQETTALGDDPELLQLKRDQQELETKYEHLSSRALTLESELQDLFELLADQKSFLAALPTRKPVVGYFTSGFGVRRSPYGGGVEKMHEGLDIANRPGTPIKSTAFGTVHFAGPKPGYGKTVIVDHGYGLQTWYGHSNSVLVKSGEKVKRGQPIATVGSTGRSTGPHVHYEVRVNGIPVDPLSYILEE